MGDDQSRGQVQIRGEDLERETREGRKFSLAEAIGRLAGPGMMKGVSPATEKQQAEADVESFVERHLNSPAGALSVVLLRQVKESEFLLNNYEQPLVALAMYVQRVLDSEYLLQEFVRQSDVEWARTYGERPYFEKEGCPPHPDDPYTIASVPGILFQLAAKLAAGESRTERGFNESGS